MLLFHLTFQCMLSECNCYFIGDPVSKRFLLFLISCIHFLSYLRIYVLMILRSQCSSPTKPCIVSQDKCTQRNCHVHMFSVSFPQFTLKVFSLIALVLDAFQVPEGPILLFPSTSAEYQQWLGVL